LKVDTNGFHEGVPARAADIAAVPGQSDAAEAQMLPGRLTVLVGSDDPFTRQAFCTGARRPGIEIVADGTLGAVTGQLASELEPYVVLLDVQTTAARALRAIQRKRFRCQLGKARPV